LREKPGKKPVSLRKSITKSFSFQLFARGYPAIGSGNSAAVKPGTESANREITGYSPKPSQLAVHHRDTI
jgi:hypothetical protein